MIRIGDTYVGRGIGCDIGDYVVINLTVIGIESHVDFDVWIKSLKVFNRLIVNRGLSLVGIVLGPEGNFEVS